MGHVDLQAYKEVRMKQVTFQFYKRVDAKEVFKFSDSTKEQLVEHMAAAMLKVSKNLGGEKSGRAHRA